MRSAWESLGDPPLGRPRRVFATDGSPAIRQFNNGWSVVVCHALCIGPGYEAPSVDVGKLRQWQQTGGMLRVVELSEQQAVVDLCACTGELMERWSTRDPAVIRRLHAAASSAESASSGGEWEPRMG